MTRLYLALGSGMALVLLIGALIFFVRADGAKALEIDRLENQLAQRDATIETIRAEWAASIQREGVTHAEAARICAAEGSSAFDRGVAFGRASCGL